MIFKSLLSNVTGGFTLEEIAYALDLVDLSSLQADICLLEDMGLVYKSIGIEETVFYLTVDGEKVLEVLG